jgi:hypothetical protein
MLIRGRWRDAWRLWRAALAQAPDAATRRQILALLPFAARRLLAAAIGRG